MERKEAGSGEEGTDPAGLFSQPVSHVLVGGGHNQREDGANANEQQTCSVDRPPSPNMLEPVPVQRSGVDQDSVDGGEESQRHLRPHLGIEVAVGSGPGQEGDGAGGRNVLQASPSLSGPSVPRNRRSDSM